MDARSHRNGGLVLFYWRVHGLRQREEKVVKSSSIVITG